MDTPHDHSNTEENDCSITSITPSFRRLTCIPLESACPPCSCSSSLAPLRGRDGVVVLRLVSVVPLLLSWMSGSLGRNECSSPRRPTPPGLCCGFWCSAYSCPSRVCCASSWCTCPCSAASHTLSSSAASAAPHHSARRPLPHPACALLHPPAAASDTACACACACECTDMGLKGACDAATMGLNGVITVCT